MKSVFTAINIFILSLIISIRNVISLIELNFPSAISLLNGNIFVVEKKGIFVYDEQLKNIIYNYNFKEESEQINSLSSLSAINIKLKNNYIICLINLKVYFFDYEGKLIKETEKIITDENIYYPTLIPIPFSNDNFYYYIIGYLSYSNEKSCYIFKLLYYKINLYDNTNNFISDLTLDIFTSSFWKDKYAFLNQGLSCDYMQDATNKGDNYLTCFFIVQESTKPALSHNFFDVTTSIISINNKYYYDYIKSLNEVRSIQSVVTNNRQNAFVCLLFTDKSLDCYKFHYEDGFWTDSASFYQNIKINFDCRSDLYGYGMKLNYLVNMQNIALSCINSNSTVQAMFFDDSLNFVKSSEQFTDCDSIYGHSILYSKNYSDYYVVSDVICNNIIRAFEPLIGTLSEIEIIDIIPPTQKHEIFFEFEEEEKSEEKINEEMIEQNYEKENEQLIEEEFKQQFDCSGLEKCKECNEESFNKKLCIICNNEKKYYYLNHVPSEPRNKYINCVNETTKPSRYYFNKKNEDYEPCFITCASCEYGGNYEENNCTSCDDVYYIKNPEDENSSNCVIKCKYFYYIQDDVYTCTDIPFCPEDYNYLIRAKSKCTDNCSKDKEYKYNYNRECFKQCPNNTKDYNNAHICKDIIKNNECFLTESETNFINENISFNEIENFVIKYISEFNYTDNHVSLYKNNDYTITIYIKNKCIFELNLGLPEIDFGTCYKKLLNNNESLNEKLIIAIIDKKIDLKNTRKVLKYRIFSPLTGKYLNSDEICKEDKIIVTESIEDKLLDLKINLNILRDFVNDGVDIFNLSSPFYNDLCYQYNSTKDIPLKDRILEFFPNITLCDEGCDLKGINMTTIIAICECYYSESKREDELKNKVLEQAQINTFEEIISSSNIYVVKCIKLVFNTNIIKKCYGSFIILFLIIIEIICTTYYCLRNIFSINKYIFGITNKFIKSLLPKDIISKNNNKVKKKAKKLLKENKNNAPPKIDIKDRKQIINNNQENITIIKKSKNSNILSINGNLSLTDNKNKKTKIKKNYEAINSNKISINNHENIKEQEGIKYKENSNIDFSNISDKSLISPQKLIFPQDYNSLFQNIKDDIDINMDEYLEVEYNDMDYDEAIRKDHRKFCASFADKLKDNQIIINTFFLYEPIKPKAIKIILLILQIKLYFFVNGLFYDEEYISKIYHLEKDTFLTIADRFFDNLIYSALVGIIVSYIIEFLFIEEKKIKKILKMEKENIFILKYEMIKILKSIKTRYLLFIIISFFISIIALIHILCFNIVYYHTMEEWIIFSIIIILSIQIATFLICLFETCLRFISFKFKSEKLFKLSNI